LKRAHTNRRLTLQELEPRQLLSADFAPIAIEPAPLPQSPLHQAVVATLAAPDAASQYSGALELVFVDPRVPDRDTLLADLQASGRRFEIITLDTERDGIVQVTEALAERMQVDAVHFVTHGTDAAVQLGGSWLNAKTLAANLEAVASWGHALKEDGDLLFYGCDLAASASGRALVDWIAELTQADVAASVNATGAASRGADWTLEHRHGTIEAAIAVSAAEQASWAGVLAAGVTVTPLGTTTTEASGTAVISIVLNEAPAADVVIPVSISDSTEAKLSVSSLTFTTANWNVAQQVTVTGVDDSQPDGDIGYTFVTGDPTSADANYNALTAGDVADVAMTNVDDDRVTTGVVALYLFDETSGQVLDKSNFGTALNLTISDPGVANVVRANGALTINNTGGETNTIITSNPTNATKIRTALQATNEVTIEAWVQPANTTNSGPARIVSMSSDTTNRDFMLSQGTATAGDGDQFTARLRTTTSDANGNPTLAGPNNSADTSLQHVVFTRDSTGVERLYVNGVQVATQTKAGDFSTWADYFLHLGNEQSLDRVWLGTMHLVAVYDRDLSAAQIQRNYSAGADAHTLVVDTANDVLDGDTSSIGALLQNRGADGLISLREAITAANNTAGADTITFNIGGGAGVKTINLTTALPDVTGAVTIDGTTQAGWTPDTLMIELRPQTAGAEFDGLRITGGSSTVRGLVINRFGDDDGDTTGAGIVLTGGGGNTIAGNWIGLGSDGTTDRGNVFGIYINGSANNIIGGATAADRNVIGGNQDEQIRINGDAADGNRIIGNYIGTDVTGTLDRGADSDGVLIWNGADNNRVGGTAPGEGNLIAFNGWGVSVAGDNSDGNAILGNRIHSHTAMGIELDPVAGNDTNDLNDPDTNRPNNGQNFPTISSATSNGDLIRIVGALNSLSSTPFRIEFFANSSNDREGERYLGFTHVTTSGNDASFDVTFVAPVAAGEYVTATATRSNASFTTFTDTSEFSPTRVVTATAGNAISGTVFEDVDGDADVAEAGTQRVVGAVVHLWVDLTGTPTYVGSTTTDADGNYGFLGLANGVHGVVVDSKSIAPSAGFNSGFGQGHVWADQTYSGAGGVYWDGAALAYTATAGALFGGLDSPVGGLSDDMTDPFTFEHIIRADLSGAAVTGADFGFSFSAITNDRGDNTDDDGSNPRMQQGTLRQFVLNSNAIAGTQAANFSIGSGVRTIALAAGLNNITDAVVLDGTTQEGYTGTPLIALNGAGAGAGVDGLMLAAGASGSTVRGLAIYGFLNDGIGVRSSNNQILDNYIGTDTGGLVDLGNAGDGIDVRNGATGNLIRGNVIIGNASDGIVFDGAGTSGNTVQANRIGVDVGGNFDANRWGVRLQSGAGGTLIGGTNPGDGNIIGGNLNDGVTVVNAGTGNTILGNSIYSNGANGIDLNNDGVTANDAGDGDPGPNSLQNYPVLASATGSPSSITISGTLNSTPGRTFRIEFFANAVADGSGYGEGDRYLGFTTVVAGAGATPFSANLSAAVANGEFVSATATDLTTGDTSEFSQNVTAVIANTPPVATDDAYTVTHDTTLATAAGWWDANWDYRRTIAIDNPTSSALTDFPLRIRLDATFDYSKAKADGSDLRFIDADGVTQLAYQIESWNPGGDSFVWVKVPNVALGSDSITMYYGNAAAASPGSGTAVWSDGYRAVYQFGSDPGAGGPVPDLTGNGLDGLNAGAVHTTAGTVNGGALDFDPALNPTSDYVDLGAGNYINNVSSATFTAWINPDSLAPGSQHIVGATHGTDAGSSRTAIELAGDEVRVIFKPSDGAAGGSVTTSSANLVSGTWYHVAAIVNYTAGSVTVHVNGGAAAGGYTQTFTGIPQLNTVTSNTNSFAATLGVNETGSGIPYGGLMDGVTISTVARSAAEIQAHYLNVTDNGAGGFVDIGAESQRGVLANDTDPDNDALTVVEVNGVAGNVGNPTATTQGGTVTLNADGTFTYTPPAGFSGIDTFTYTASDGNGGTDIATVTITVTGNVAPQDLTATNTTNGGLAINTGGGNDAYLAADDGAGLLGGLTQLTFEIRFSSPSIADGEYPTFVSYATPTANDGIWFGAYKSGASEVVGLSLNGGWAPVNYDVDTLFDGSDHSIAFTWTQASGAWAIYVDGVQIGSGTGIATGQSLSVNGSLVLAHDQDAGLGTYYFEPGNALKGTLYDIRFFDDVRTPAEIAANYDVTVAPGEPNLIANWTMNDISTSDAMPDVVGGNDLTVRHVTQAGFTAGEPALTLAVAEGSANGTVVGTITATDDVPSGLAYSLTDSAGGRFAIDANTGQVTVANGSLLDYETQTSHDVTVRVTDGGGLTYDEVFTVNLIDVFDPNNTPTTGGIADVTVDEDAADTVIDLFAAFDDVEDADGALTYAVVGNTNPALFGAVTVNGVAGTLTLDYAPDAFGTADITVRATDTGGAFVETTFTVTVNPLNDAPVAVDDAYTVTEDATLSVGWWDLDWTRRQQVVFSGNTFGGAENLADFPVLLVLDSGNIDYALTQDDGGDLRFFDADGTALDYEIERWDEAGDSYVWVKVPQVDTSGTDSIWMYYGNAAAPDGQSSAAVWGAYGGVWHLDEDPAGIAPQMTDSTGNANDGSAVNAPVQTTGQLHAALDFDGGAERYVSVAHDASLALPGDMSVSAWVTVTSAPGDTQHRAIAAKWDDAPGAGKNYWLGIIGGDTLSFDVDNNSQSVGITLADLDTTFGIDLKDAGWHHVAAVADGAAGQLRLYVDGLEVATAAYDGASQIGTSDLHIANSPDVPLQYWIGAIDEVRVAGAAHSTAWQTAEYLAQTGAFVTLGGEQSVPALGGVVSNDADADADALTVTEVNGQAADVGTQITLASGALLTVNPNGTLAYDPNGQFESLAVGQNAIDTFTYTVSDGNGGTDTATVTITITGVNDAPVITSDGGGATANVSVAENQSAVTDVNATDQDAGDTLSYAISGGADAALFSIVPGSGVLTFAAAPDFENPTDADTDGVYEVEVTVSDGNGGTDVQLIRVTVTDANDAPAGADNTIATLEDNAYAFAAGDFGFTDVDAGDTLGAVRIDTLSLAAGATLQLSGVDVAAGQVIGAAQIANLVFTPAPNANGAGYSSFTFSVQDAGGPTFDPTPNTMTIDVTPVNDPSVVTTSGGTLAYPGSGAATVDSSVTVTDVDDATLAGATIQITGGYVAGEDLLGFTGAGGITGSWDAASGTLTLTGPATLADWQTVLRSLTYQNASADPTAGTRVITLVADDGTNVSAPATRTIDVGPAGTIDPGVSPSPPPGPGGDGGGTSVNPPSDPPAPGADAGNGDDEDGASGLDDPAPVARGSGDGDAGIPEPEAALPVAPSTERIAAEKPKVIEPRIETMTVMSETPTVASTAQTARPEFVQTRSQPEIVIDLGRIAISDTDGDRVIQLDLDAIRMTSLALSIGAVWWATRATGLLASLLSSLPAWRNFDPLPVLARNEDEEEEEWAEADEDEESRKEEDAVTRTFSNRDSQPIELDELDRGPRR